MPEEKKPAIIEVTATIKLSDALENIESDVLLKELAGRKDLPQCEILHVEEADQEQLEEALMEHGVNVNQDRYALDCLRWGIQDRDWKRIEEAAQILGVYTHRLKVCNKPALPNDVLLAAIQDKPERA